MYSSQKDIILKIYSDPNTVYTLADIGMLIGDSNFSSLNQRLNYAVRTGKLINPRRGLYAKQNYSKEELACRVYAPSYISLEYVLQKAGVIFQYNSQISCVSYLRRDIDIDGQIYSYRKLKGEILVNTVGIIRQNNLNIALPERAALDLLYLNKACYFDNPAVLDKKKLLQFAPLYHSKALVEKLQTLIDYV